MDEEGVGDRQPLGLCEGIGDLPAPGEFGIAGGLGRLRQDGGAVRHHGLIRRLRPVPLDHGEFRRMQGPALAVAEDAGKIDDPLLAGRQQLLQREFRRGVQIAGRPGAVRADHFGGKSVQMGLVAGRDLQDRRLGLDEALAGEPGMKRRHDAVAGEQQRAPVAMALAVPEGRQSGHFRQVPLAISAYNPLAVPGKIAKVRAELAAAKRRQSNSSRVL